MPRPKAPKITAVTDDLLAERWDNENACRMWLRRRGTSPTKLGLAISPIDGAGGVRLVRGMDLRPVTAEAQPDFETWAVGVDELLEAAGEDPETDEMLRELMGRCVTPVLAMADIVLRRRGPGAPSPSSIVRQTLEEQADAVDKDSAPRLAAGLFFVQLGLPMDLLAAQRLAARAAKALRADALICGSAGGRAIQTISAPARKATAGTNGTAKKDHWSRVRPLLERAEGVSVDEVKRLLGWQTAPGKWFFEKWALDGGRERDLIDMGHVEGVRRFRLRATESDRR